MCVCVCEYKVMKQNNFKKCLEARIISWRLGELQGEGLLFLQNGDGINITIYRESHEQIF